MMVAGEGFEPSRRDPESRVLPLDDPAISLCHAMYPHAIYPKAILILSENSISVNSKEPIQTLFLLTL